MGRGGIGVVGRGGVGMEAWLDIFLGDMGHGKLDWTGWQERQERQFGVQVWF